MTTAIQTASHRETLEQAVQRFSASALHKGYKLEGVYPYATGDGDILFWRVRLKHPDGKKKFPAFHWDGQRYVAGEQSAPAEGKPLYRLPKLLASRSPVVIVVEGECKADALIALGGTATTSGGATSAEGADWSACEGRMALCFRDNDAAGLKYARDVTRRLHARQVHTDWIDVGALGLSDGGDVIDWLAMCPDATWEDVLQLPRLVAPDMGDASSARPAAVAAREPARPARREPAQARPRPVPELLRRPVSRAQPYPLEALGGVLGGAATRIREVVQSPAGLCGQSVLSAASLAVQALADVSIDGRRIPLSLWHLSIGESGERKSATDALALRAHRERERALADDFVQELAAYEGDASAHKAALRRMEAKGEPDEIRAARKALGPAPQRPLEPRMLLNEPTLEGVQRLCQRGRPSMGLFNDDAGDCIHGHAMSSDNRVRTAAVFSRMWDAGEMSRTRGGDGTSKWYGRRLAMHLMIQPVIAEQLLSDRALLEQGFLARYLVCWPESTIGTREYVAEDLMVDPVMQSYWERIHGLLAMPAAMKPGTRNELDPRTLTLAPNAKALWIEVINHIERDLRDVFQSVRGTAGKADAQILRIAGVLTLVEDAYAGTIPLDMLERAAHLMQYHLDEAVRIIGTSSPGQPIEHAESLLQWCRRTKREWLYSTDVLRNGPSAIRTRDAFLVAMKQLQDAGWVEPEQHLVLLDGKPRARAWPIRQEALAVWARSPNS
jgi:hypothetical protein